MIHKSLFLAKHLLEQQARCSRCSCASGQGFVEDFYRAACYFGSASSAVLRQAESTTQKRPQEAVTLIAFGVHAAKDI